MGEALRNRGMRVESVSTGTTLGAEVPMSAAAGSLEEAREALTFTIESHILLYRSARAEKSFSSAVSHLEGAALGALKMGSWLTSHASVELDRAADAALKARQPIYISRIAKVFDLMRRRYGADEEADAIIAQREAESAQLASIHARIRKSIEESKACHARRHRNLPPKQDDQDE